MGAVELCIGFIHLCLALHGTCKYILGGFTSLPVGRQSGGVILALVLLHDLFTLFNQGRQLGFVYSQDTAGNQSDLIN